MSENFKTYEDCLNSLSFALNTTKKNEKDARALSFAEGLKGLNDLGFQISTKFLYGLFEDPTLSNVVRRKRISKAIIGYTIKTTFRYYKTFSSRGYIVHDRETLKVVSFN